MRRRAFAWIGTIDLGTAAAVSFAVHAIGALAVLLVVRAVRGLVPAAPPEPVVPSAIAIELAPLEERAAASTTARPLSEASAASLPRPGGDRVARVDGTRAGRGGDDRAREVALHIADRAEPITRDPSVFSSPEANQLARLRSGEVRRTIEDQRASLEPMSLTFVAMGDRAHEALRREEALRDPAQGLRDAAARVELGASTVGARDATVASDGLDGAAVGESAREGGLVRTTGLGFELGGPRGTQSAAIRNARARPLVERGAPSTTARDAGRPTDDVEAEQAVAARMQALMHASTMGGAVRANGAGGERGPSQTPASGGDAGSGSSVAALGAGGTGRGDVERVGYVRDVQRKIHPLWADAFPKDAIAAGRGGTAIVAFVIERDGRVSSARVVRPSGEPVFDENVRRAVLRGAPYGPLPAALGERLAWAMPFTAVNPAVRPAHPVDGPTR